MRGKPLARFVLVALLIVLSAFGVPALVSFARPDRVKPNVAIELIVEDQRRP